MEICDFAFHRPETVAEACELGRRHGDNARFLAGGTELLPDLKQHRDETQHLIDLRRLDELKQIRLDEGFLRIGATATLTEVAESPLVLDAAPALSEAILTMAALQIRNRGTLGGNFCGGVPSADTPPICIALGSQMRIGGPSGTRDLPGEAFFVGPRQVALDSGELVLDISVPIRRGSVGGSYQRFALRQATALAVAGVAAWVLMEQRRVSDARVVLGAVAPIPMLADECGNLLRGQEPTDSLIEKAGDAAVDAARPITDLRGSAEFRRELVRVLTMRAIRTAVARAMNGGEGQAR